MSSAITNLSSWGWAFPTPYLSKAWVGRTILGWSGIKEDRSQTAFFRFPIFWFRCGRKKRLVPWERMDKRYWPARAAKRRTNQTLEVGLAWFLCYWLWNRNDIQPAAVVFCFFDMSVSSDSDWTGTYTCLPPELVVCLFHNMPGNSWLRLFEQRNDDATIDSVSGREGVDAPLTNCDVRY